VEEVAAAAAPPVADAPETSTIAESLMLRPLPDRSPDNDDSI
jgi:hypothetical protein